MLFDNSKIKPVLIAKKRDGRIEVIDESVYATIQRLAGA
jgi:hypothetical protein